MAGHVAPLDGPAVRQRPEWVARVPHALAVTAYAVLVYGEAEKACTRLIWVRLPRVRPPAFRGRARSLVAARRGSA